MISIHFLNYKARRILQARNYRFQMRQREEILSHVTSHMAEHLHEEIKEHLEDQN